MIWCRSKLERLDCSAYNERKMKDLQLNIFSIFLVILLMQVLNGANDDQIHYIWILWDLHGIIQYHMSYLYVKIVPVFKAQNKRFKEQLCRTFWLWSCYYFWCPQGGAINKKGNRLTPTSTKYKSTIANIFIHASRIVKPIYRLSSNNFERMFCPHWHIMHSLLEQ